MKTPTPRLTKLLALSGGLGCALLAGNSHAQVSTNYWDVNGADSGAGSSAPNGNWEDAYWSTDPNGAVNTANWADGSLAYFSAGMDAYDSYTVTANADHTITGIQLQYPPLGAVTINGPGRLLLPDGMYPLAGGAPSLPLTINAVLAGTGGCLIPANTVVYLGGANTFSGGCALGGGQAYFNNNNSFGTGPITNTLGGFSALLAYGGAPLTLPNDFEMNMAGNGINFASVVADTPVTCTGNWDLQQTLRLRNNSDNTCPLTLSGVISGAPGKGLAISGNYGINLGGTITLSGANTFDGPVSIGDGGDGATLVVSSFNSVGNPQPSSSLGRPTSVANGTIRIGLNSTTNTLIYVGPGETTDRVIDFAGTARGPWLEADGTGPIVFTSDFTATGSGAAANTKALILQGTNTANNEVRGKIVDHGVDNSINFQTAVTKLGTGTWMLSGPNTYSGNTTISGGTLKIGADNTLPYGTGKGDVSIDGSGALATLDLNGHNINVNGLALGAANQFNAVIDNTSGTGTYTITLGNNNKGFTTYGAFNNSSGSLKIIKTGSGNLTLRGNSGNSGNFSGGVTVNQGDLWLENDANLGTGNGPLTLNGGRLRCNNVNNVSISASRTVVLGPSGGTLCPAYGKWITINSKITGTGILKSANDGSGAGFILANPANDWQGGLNVGNGETGSSGAAVIIRLGANDVIPHGNNAGDVKVAGWGAKLDLAGYSTTINGLSGDANGSIDNTASTASTLTVGDHNGGGTFNGTIKNSGSGGTLALTKIGAGTLTLTHANSYAGNTTISAGKLALSGSGTVGSSPIISIAGGATLDVSALTTALTLGGSQTLQAGGTSGSPAVLATASGKGLALGASSPLQFTAYDGTTEAPLTVIGAGSLVLAAGNAVTVNTTTVLVPRSYKLVSIGSGNTAAVTGMLPGSVTVTGSGMVAGGSASLRMAGGELFLDICTTPTVFQVTGGGSYTTGGAGVPVGLDGSQIGVNYQLKLGAGNVGLPVAGTGSALSFGNQTAEGTYTAVATSAAGGCTANMNGSATVTIDTTTTPVTITGITATAITYTGGSGSQFVLLRTNNLAAPLSGWTRVHTNPATPGSFTINTADPSEFYRIKSE